VGSPRGELGGLDETILVQRGVGGMKRWLFFLYGTANYVLFFVVYAWFCLFTGNLLLSRTIDRPAVGAGGSSPAAAVVDLALLAAFGLQHSIMARPGFKRVWTRVVPQTIERATYMLASNVVLAAAMWFWQPLPTVLWNAEQPAARGVLWALFAAGWLGVPAVSFMINHFDLFGMRQVWHYLRGQQPEPLPFRTPLAYARVRHPLYIGWAIAFWATPTMTVGHLLFAVTLTGYMVLATFIEERDLVAHFGKTYEDYQRRVPRFLPRLGGGRAVETPALGVEVEPASGNG
jgi:protein-S-isoprenylcysteine O-methyltransferase Ste14